MTAPLLTGQLLAQRELNDYTVTPGVLGFVIFAALGVGVWLLLKSMTRQLNRVRFEEPDAVTKRTATGAGPRGTEPAAAEPLESRSASAP